MIPVKMSDPVELKKHDHINSGSHQSHQVRRDVQICCYPVSGNIIHGLDKLDGLVDR